tara:strand:- start:205 stop:1473 length:1269 start_codon:yes stop_codon:yes gene_type:complete
MNAMGFYNKAKIDLIQGKPEHIEGYMLEATSINSDFSFLPTEVLLSACDKISDIANNHSEYYGAWLATQLLRNVFYTKKTPIELFCFPDKEVFSKSGVVNRNKFYVMAFELFFKQQDYEKLYFIKMLYSDSVDPRISKFLDEAYLNLRFGAPLKEVDNLNTLSRFMNHAFKGIYSYTEPCKISADEVFSVNYDKKCLKEVLIDKEIPVFSVYADEVYLKRFLLPYYESLCLVYGKGNFVLDATVVIMDSREFKYDIFPFMEYDDLCFNVIYLHDTTFGKDIFASIRFIDSISLIDKYSDVVVSDIDAVLEKKLPESFSNLSIACKKSDNLLPWRRYPAGAIRFKKSDEVKFFLEKVRHYLSHVYSYGDKENLWWIDQNALNYAVNELFKIKEVSIDCSFATTSCFSFSSHADKKVLSSSAQL